MVASKVQNSQFEPPARATPLVKAIVANFTVL